MTTKKKFTCPSWLNMKKEVEGYKIEINTSFSYVSIKHTSFENAEGWFFQGHDAENVIDEINYIYNTAGDISPVEAAIRWSNIYLY